MRVLNLGCGKDYREDCVNMDINPEVKCDIVGDICDPKWPTQSDQYDKIIANNVLEHVSNLMACMTNCLNMLKEDGIMEITVPHDLGWGSWEDPTHVRCFNERSFHFYWDMADYLGWKEYGFKTIRLNFRHFPEYDGQPAEIILKTPRAVTEMNITLKKEKL